MFKKALFLTRPPQAHRDAPFHSRGRSDRRAEGVLFAVRETLSDARTKLEDFFNILLISQFDERMLVFTPRFAHLHP